MSTACAYSSWISSAISDSTRSACKASEVGLFSLPFSSPRSTRRSLSDIAGRSSCGNVRCSAHRPGASSARPAISRKPFSFQPLCSLMRLAACRPSLSHRAAGDYGRPHINQSLVGTNVSGINVNSRTRNSSPISSPFGRWAFQLIALMWLGRGEAATISVRPLK